MTGYIIGFKQQMVSINILCCLKDGHNNSNFYVSKDKVIFVSDLTAEYVMK